MREDEVVTRTRRRLLLAAVVLAAVAADIGLYLFARHTDNNRLGLVLFIVNVLVIGGLAAQPTGVYLMRAGRSGRASRSDIPESEEARIERMTR